MGESQKPEASCSGSGAVVESSRRRPFAIQNAVLGGASIRLWCIVKPPVVASVPDLTDIPPINLNSRVRLQRVVACLKDEPPKIAFRRGSWRSCRTKYTTSGGSFLPK